MLQMIDQKQEIKIHVTRQFGDAISDKMKNELFWHRYPQSAYFRAPARPAETLLDHQESGKPALQAR